MKKKFNEYNLSDPMSRRTILKVTGAALGAGLSGVAGGGITGSLLDVLGTGSARAFASASALKGKPNLLFILGDNHNAQTMGCAGHPFIKTPGMDRLAREGVMFERSFNTTSLCSPSRASILTGMYAHRHGVLNNHTPWTDRESTFMEHLSRAGYATAFIGKWHMPGKLPELPFLDLFVTYTYREGQGAYFNTPMLVNGKEVPSRKPYITEEVTDYAIEFIEKNNPKDGDRPFCVYLSHRPGHPPFQAPADISGMYDEADVAEVLPPQVDPLWYGKTNQNVFQGVMMGSYYDQYRGYCETLTAMDRDIVNILDYLDRKGLSDNTIVIYMGDNGMQWGTHDCHGIREPYEDSIRLPFIVRAPGMVKDPGGKRKQMVLNIDIAPTLLDLAGVRAPADMDGMSIVPAIRNGRAKTRNDFLLEFWRYYPENTPSYRGIRTDRYKYVEFERGRDPWLFDLKKDPKEMVNLYPEKNESDLIKMLQQKLKGYP